MENENPILKEKLDVDYKVDLKDGKLQEISKKSIFEIIRHIKDPEHPYDLEVLGIVGLNDIDVFDIENSTILCTSGQPIPFIKVIFTPTVPHCSMAGIIGLSIIYQLMAYTVGYVIKVEIKEETHSMYQALNKQLSDKDRIFAAFENEGLLDIIESCINTKKWD
ncbi:Mitotic spindle-associated MMXD complex subunit MIP18 [Glugoides intestinalis]